jgi:hypothetical protein
LTASTTVSTGAYSVPFQSYNYFDSKRKREEEENELEIEKERWTERMRSVTVVDEPTPQERASRAKKDKFELRKWEVRIPLFFLDGRLHSTPVQRFLLRFFLILFRGSKNSRGLSKKERSKRECSRGKENREESMTLVLSLCNLLRHLHHPCHRPIRENGWIY